MEIINQKAIEMPNIKKNCLNMWNMNQISTSIEIYILINISEAGRMKKNVIRHAHDINLLRNTIILLTKHTFVILKQIFYFLRTK